MNDIRKALEAARAFVQMILDQRNIGACKQLAGEALADLDAALAAAPVPPAEVPVWINRRAIEHALRDSNWQPTAYTARQSDDDVECLFYGALPRAATLAAPPAEAQQPVAPDCAWEALQRLIEDGFTAGATRAEDAAIVAKYRRRFFAPTAPTGADAASEPADSLGALPSATACSVASLPEPEVSALRVPPAGAYPLLKLLEYADDSDGSQYGTLSTSLVRKLVNEALAACAGGRPEWIYRTDLAAWVDICSGRVGSPQRGDWYSDAGDWRIWW